MKVKIEQVQSGIAAFLDNELMPKLRQTHNSAVVFGANTVAALAITNLPSTLQKLKENNWVEYLGIVDEKDNIDIDALGEAARQAMPEEGVLITLPLLGNITFDQEDVTTIVKYIKK